MKKFLLLTVLLFLCLFLSAQKDFTSEYKNQIGGAAGFTTGYGISYRYWPERWGFQLTTTPYFEYQRAHASFGATVLLRLQEMSWVNLYLYLGNHLIFDRAYTFPLLHDSNGDLILDEYGNPTYASNQAMVNNYRWLTGIGPGFEFLIGKRFSYNLMFGFRSDFATDEKFKIALTAETGLYFRF